MKTYRSKLSVEEIHEWVERRAVPQNNLAWFKILHILNVKRKAEKLFFYGWFSRATGEIMASNKRVDVKLNVEFSYAIKFIFAVALGFLLLFLFTPNITINGNNDPSLLDRLTFVAIGAGIFLLPYIIFRAMKAEFRKKIEKELKLKPIAFSTPINE